MGKYNCIIGIDPGANGGIATYADGGASVFKMPRQLSDLKDYFVYIRNNYTPIVFIEKLSLQGRDYGVSGMGKIIRLQRMLQNYEQLKAIVSVCNIDYAQVAPLTWQSRLKLRIKGEEKPQRKARYKIEASKRYPALKSTLWSCDAILIMQFGIDVILGEYKDKTTSRKDKKYLDKELVLNNKNMLFEEDLEE